MNRQTTLSPKRNTLLVNTFLSKSYKIKQSVHPNNRISTKQRNNTEPTYRYSHSHLIRNPIKQQTEEYQKMKEKVKDKIKRIISEKRFDIDDGYNKQSKIKLKTDSSLCFLQNIYFDYLKKQILPSKQKKPSLLLQSHTPRNINLNNFKKQESRNISSINLRQKPSLSRIRFSKSRNTQKIQKSESSKAVMQNNLSVQKMILTTHRIKRSPKLIVRSIANKSKKKNQVSAFLQDLEPWSNQNNY